MSRSVYINVIRHAVLIGVMSALLLPFSFSLFWLVDRYLISFPTLYLLGVTGCIVVVGGTVTMLTPVIRRSVERTLFSGSYDYVDAVRELTAQVIEDTQIQDVLRFTCDELAHVIGAKNVNILSASEVVRLLRASELTQSQHLIVGIPQTPKTSRTYDPSSMEDAFIVLGEKLSGDPWSAGDAKLLQWFAHAVAIHLNVGRQRQFEQRRLEQIRELVKKRTSELAALNRRLAKRDHDHAVQLDELAHDLKNPITVISQTLANAPLTNQPYPRLLETLRLETAWMTRFLDHILDLARAEAGKITPQRIGLSLADILDDTLESVAGFAATQHKRIQWASFVIHERKIEIQADPFLLYKMLQLLFVRAIRLSRDVTQVAVITDLIGKRAFVDIAIDARPSQDNPSSMLIHLTHQPTHHQDRRFGITGLELSLAQWIMHAHGGSLLVTEVEHKRTVIRAEFPLFKVKAGQSINTRLRRQALSVAL
jgi:K+-sensing histidine kinase KdpD